jgi:putative phosphoesterase
MQIAIISDIHDNIWALEAALTRLGNCEVLLCLGDICSPFTMIAIGEGFPGPVHVVWGNNDGDRVHVAQSVSRLERVTFHGEFGELELGGRKIAITHWPDVAKALANGGTFDLVCHGHNHRRRADQFGNTLLVNPGEVMGRLGERSVAIYDTETNSAELVLF